MVGEGEGGGEIEGFFLCRSGGRRLMREKEEDDCNVVWGREKRISIVDSFLFRSFLFCLYS